MKLVDTQIHVWQEESVDRPWNQEFAQPRRVFLNGGLAVTPDRAVAAMDAVGVDLALVTSFLLYPDISYALAAVQAHPTRFRLVPQVDLAAESPLRLAEEYVALPEVVALRLSFLVDGAGTYLARLDDGAYEQIFNLAIKRGLPVMVLLTGNLDRAGKLAATHPDLTVIIDHLGLVQGPHRHVPDDPFTGFDALLRLAVHPNVLVKLTGAPALSRGPYPFADVVPRIRALIDAFGAHRVMWGTDFGRTRSMHTYAEALFYLLHSSAFTDEEKRHVLGGTAMSTFRLPETT